jgi:L-threonylcarbamoyladenylate synthase
MRTSAGTLLAMDQGLGASEIDVAVAALRAGGLVAFPTETVYGLGADAANPDAVRRLFAVKGRPVDHPVIVHVGDPEHLGKWAAEVPPVAAALARAFWPGPLTVIVPRGPQVATEVTGGRATVGIRMPNQPLALALLRAFGGGVAAPSANRFGRVSPTRAADVVADLGNDVAVVLDGGPCSVGVESTIVDCTTDPPVIARLGGITQAAIEARLGCPVAVRDRGEVAVSGTLEVHYSPTARVHVVRSADVAARATSLLATGARVALLAMDPPAGLPTGLVVLDSPRDVDDYAHILYARLRDADARHINDLLVVAPPPEGIGAAVVDRLERAAS